MDFLEIAKKRQSCRNYDEAQEVEQEKLEAVLEAGRLAPSAVPSANQETTAYVLRHQTAL